MTGHATTSHRRRLRMLVVMARPLYPADTGGRIRSSQIFERLATQHDITLVCFRTPSDPPEAFERMRACCSRLEVVDWHETRKFSLPFYVELLQALFSPLPYAAWKYRSTAMMRCLEVLLAAEPFDLLLCDFLQPSVNCVHLALRPKVLFEHNVEAVIRARQVAYTRGWLAKGYVWLEAQKLRRFEARVAQQFDHCLMVSDEDCRTMQELYGVTHASTVPTGVDVDYFSPGGREAAQPTVVFVGSMDWLPNQDGVEWFSHEVLPLIRRRVDARFVVVGRNPPASVRALVGDYVHVTGTVPDVRPYMAAAHVVVVPIRIGGGTRIKIFEALAMGKAVVSTPIGAEGLPVTDGTDVLLATDSAAVAAAVLRAMQDPQVRASLGEAGRHLVVGRHSWDAAAERFSEACSDVVHRFHTGN